MRKDVEHFVATCPVCQLVKTESKKAAGLLQPLPVPEAIWSDVSMNFVVGLPKSKGKTVVLVVVDRLTKYAHFVAMAKRFTALSVANAFVADICRLHGIPRSIVSDRDPIFVSTFWEEIFRLSGTLLQRSTAYHPETDGQTEVTNKGLEQYLRSFCMDHPEAWTSFLPWAEFSYNSATHSATRMSPFQAVYGRPPPPILEYTEEQTPNAAAHQFLTTRDALLKTLRANLAEAQNRMKQMADRSRRDVQFDVGDRVLVRLQAYRQLSLADHTYSKIRRRFYGPFSVVKRIGSVAYKLALPGTSRLHPVFHVSKMKLFREDLALHPLPLPPDSHEGKIVVKPAAIIRQRWLMGRNYDKLQVLVRWEGLTEEENTWVDMEEFKAAFPDHDLGDKVCVDEGSNVMPQDIICYRRAKQANGNEPKRGKSQLGRAEETNVTEVEEIELPIAEANNAGIDKGPSTLEVEDNQERVHGPSNIEEPRNN